MGLRTSGTGLKYPIFGGQDIVANVLRDADQSISHNTSTAIIFDTIFYQDPSTMVNLGTDPTKVFFRSPGKYQGLGCGTFAENATGLRQFWILLDDGRRGAIPEIPGDTGSQSGMVCFGEFNITGSDIVAGRYMSLFCYQNSGGPLIAHGGNDMNLVVRKVDRAG